MISLLLEFAFSETKNFYMFVPWGHNQRRGTFQSSSTRNLPLEVDNAMNGHDCDWNENYGYKSVSDLDNTAEIYTWEKEKSIVSRMMTKMTKMTMMTMTMMAMTMTKMTMMTMTRWSGVDFAGKSIISQAPHPLPAPRLDFCQICNICQICDICQMCDICQIL